MPKDLNSLHSRVMDTLRKHDGWCTDNEPERRKITKAVLESLQVNPIKEFVDWRYEVDQDLHLDVFDLALGWFSARGFTHDDALVMAQSVREDPGWWSRSEG